MRSLLHREVPESDIDDPAFLCGIVTRAEFKNSAWLIARLKGDAIDYFDTAHEVFLLCLPGSGS